MNFSKPLTDLSTENLREQLLEAETALQRIKNSPDRTVSVTCGYFFRNEKQATEICLIEHIVHAEFVRNELAMICQNMKSELQNR